MSKRFVTIVLGMLILVMQSPGQTRMPDRSQPTGFRDEVFGLGFFAGPAGGLGLSFRHHFRIPFSYQITGGIINADNRLLYDVGIEAQYDLSRSQLGRFFVAGGFSYFYSGDSRGNELSGPARMGLGGGGELGISPVLTGTIEVLFTYFSDGTVLPLPQVGIFFYF
jgi:hypothetical protein